MLINICEKNNLYIIKNIKKYKIMGHFMDYISYIITFLLGLGAGISLKIIFDKNTITQVGNKAGRDIIGRKEK